MVAVVSAAMVAATFMAAAGMPAAVVTARSAMAAAMKVAPRTAVTAAMKAAPRSAMEAAAAPAMPTRAAAPAEPATIGIAAPVPARSMPTARIKAILASAQKVLHRRKACLAVRALNAENELTAGRGLRHRRRYNSR